MREMVVIIVFNIELNISGRLSGWSWWINHQDELLGEFGIVQKIAQSHLNRRYLSKEEVSGENI
jgi:hypothetical protein